MKFHPSDIVYGKHDLKLLREQFVLKGVPSSPGIVIGNAKVIKADSVISPNEIIPAEDIYDEIIRFDNALHSLSKQFIASLNKVKNESSNIIAILETNLMILTDPMLEEAVKAFIGNGFSAESAIVTEFEKQRNFFKNSTDEFLKERAIELDHIKEKLLAELRNRTISFENTEGAVVIAQALTTTDIVNFHESKIGAIVTEIGGITSHSSILSRSFDIPAVIGVKDATLLIEDNTTVIVDGFAGLIVVQPKDEILSLYRKKISEIESHKAKLGELAKMPAETRDGKKIKLNVNVNFLDDVRAGEINGADGVGLVRSESLIMELSQIPDEETQYNWYKEISDRAYPKPVTLRVFDIGSDKYSEGLPFQESNPALGLRGIRLLLSRKDIFETQLRAILRASVNKNIKLMLPMISSLHEVEHSLEIISKVKNELIENGVNFDNSIPIGVMIETPAAAIIADGLAEAVDFFSIGTNDLTQYTLAADRNNELVSDVFDSFHPAVLRLIDLTVRSAKKAGISVSVCGELAGHSASTDILLGLGIDELSVAPSIVLELKNRIRNLDYNECSQLADEILNCSGYEEVRIRLDKAINAFSFNDNDLLINNN